MMSQREIDPVSATLSEMSQALRKREISPVELVTATLERIEALQPRLRCFTTLSPEHALQRARAAEHEISNGKYRGPLHGIPYTLKDVVGMKASFGRVSRFGVWASAWSSDQAGPLTRTIEDNALMLEILGVYDPKDPVSLNQPRQAYRDRLHDGVKGVRVGVPVDDWIWKEWLSEEEEEVVRRAISVLETLGASLTEVRLPHSAAGRATLHTIIPSEAQTFLEDHSTPDQIAAC